MTDGQNKKPTSEEMIRRARQGSTPSEPTDQSADRATPAPDSPALIPDHQHEPETAASPASAEGRPTEGPVGSTYAAPPPYFPPVSDPKRNWLSRVPVGWLIGGLIFAGFSVYGYFTSADRDESGAVVAAGDLASDEFRIGDCLLLPSGVAADGSYEFESLQAVPCSEAHDMEVFGQVTAPVGSYPGEDALVELGDTECREPFATYVGLPFEQEARLAYSVSFPFEESWSAGDRRLDCLLESGDGTQMIGSHRGAGLLGFGGLLLGSCYDFTETATYVFFTELPCSEPHLVQLYGEDIMTGAEGSSYPGNESVETAAGSFCADRFDKLITLESGEGVDFFWVAPDADTWTFGDRLIQCFFVSTDGSPLLTGYATAS